MNSVEPASVPVPVDDDDDLAHLTCCIDTDISMCGTDAAAMDWVEADDPVLWCVVCVELYEHPTFCPRFGECPP